MLELNRKAEVAVHGQAADMEWTLERRAQDNWVLVVEAPSSVGIAAGDDGSAHEQPIPRLRKSFVLTNEQASATLALWVGEFERDGVVNAKLYAVAEEVWRNVETHFRVIP